MGVVVREIKRPPADVVERFRGLGAATVHEALGKETANVMDWPIKPIHSGMKVAGPAVTALCFPSDNITVHKALTLVSPGDVLVIDGHGVPGAMWGGQLSYQAKIWGLSGVVVDGSVRDVEEIRRMNFSCFARLVTPMGSAKGTPGSVNVPVQCGGVLVSPGDIVLGDDDGVVVVPRDMAESVLARSQERLKKEEAMRELFEQRRTSFDIYGFEKTFAQKGVEER